MAVFDPKQVSALISGQAISDWADGSAVIKVEPVGDAGSYQIGADGKGVFVVNANRSVTLTLEIKQHSADNKWLNDKLKQQTGSIKTFLPLSLEIRDLVNADLVTAQKGYFNKQPSFQRGSSLNNTVWTIVFESGSMNLEAGHGN